MDAIAGRLDKLVQLRKPTLIEILYALDSFDFELCWTLMAPKKTARSKVYVKSASQ